MAVRLHEGSARRAGHILELARINHEIETCGEVEAEHLHALLGRRIELESALRDPNHREYLGGVETTAWHADDPTQETPRACLDCDNIYRGDLKCPTCGNHSGEPLDG